jgi:hypothetical protein
MNFDEFVKKYNLLQDEEGRYYYIDENHKRHEPYSNVMVLSELLNINIGVIQGRIKYIAPIKMKNRRNNITDAYNLNEILIACNEYLGLPKTNKNGYIIINGEIYAPIAKIAELVKVQTITLKSRIKNLRPQRIINKRGSISEAYHVRSVIELYELSPKQTKKTIIKENYPRADKSGFLVLEGKTYANFHGLIILLDIPKTTIRRKIKNLKPIKIKSFSGHLCTAYSIDAVKLTCEEQLKETHTEDGKGFVFFNNKKYAHLTNLSRILNISESTIKRKLKGKNLTTIKIKCLTGHIVTAYEVDAVKKICAKNIKFLPIADKNCFALIEGKKYAPVYILSTHLKINAVAIKKYTKNLTPQKIKSIRGRTYTAYNLEDVKKACKHLLSPLPVARDDGIAVIEGKKYTPLGNIATMLNRHSATIKKRISHLHSLKIVNRQGNRVDAYNIEEVKHACSELIKK